MGRHEKLGSRDGTTAEPSSSKICRADFTEAVRFVTIPRISSHAEWDSDYSR